MKTMTSMALFLASSALLMFTASESAPVRAQQTAPAPADPRPFAERATEGAGATIFGNVCGQCHGKPEIKEAMSPDMLKQLTPENGRAHEYFFPGNIRRGIK